MLYFKMKRFILYITFILLYHMSLTDIVTMAWHVTVVFRKVHVRKLGHVVFKADHACTFIEIDLA